MAILIVTLIPSLNWSKVSGVFRGLKVQQESAKSQDSSSTESEVRGMRNAKMTSNETKPQTSIKGEPHYV
jgi:hypothetical protein